MMLTGDKKDWVLFDVMAKIGRPHGSYLESVVPISLFLARKRQSKVDWIFDFRTSHSPELGAV